MNVERSFIEAQKYSQIFHGYQPWETWCDRLLAFSQDLPINHNQFLRESLPNIAELIRNDKKLCRPSTLQELEDYKDPIKWYDHLRVAAVALLGDEPDKYQKAKQSYGLTADSLHDNPPENKSYFPKDKASREAIMYRWISDNLEEVIESFKDMEPSQFHSDIQELDTRIFIDELQKILDKRAKLNSPDYVKEESGRIAKIKTEYSDAQKKLKEQLRNLEEEFSKEVAVIKKPRLDIDTEVENHLRYPLTITVESPDTEYLSPYEGDITFGFTLEEALSLTDYIQEHNLQMEMFLGLIEATRKALEYTWPSGRESTKNQLFSSRYFEEIPGLDKVNDQFHQGLDKLYGIFFTDETEKVIKALRDATPDFEKSKQLLDEIHLPELTPIGRRTINSFFDFIMSERVTVFRRPTFQKFRYEKSSYRDR